MRKEGSALRTDADMRHPYRNAFLAAMLLFVASMLPILIQSGGVYIYSGDYNAQTIPFTEHFHALLHGDGIPAFDWQSGLGLDFLTGYVGYFFTPFTLPLMLVPAGALPYAVTFSVALKMGICAATSALYCRQFVQRNQTAFLCGMLYAFSGFQLFNLVYPFLDTVCLFPLLLYSFDKLVTEKRPLCFAVMLVLQCVSSTVLFWAECLFIMFYFIVRTAAKSFPRLTLRDALRYALESLAGVGLGGALLIPTYFSLRSNTRAGQLIFGSGLLTYDAPGVILRIVQSMVLPPEFCRNGWYFSDVQLSVSAPVLYIPLFTVIGVIAVMRKNRRAWYSLLLTLCAVMACVPLLNSLFSVCNANYYARWFFCPLLIMVMLTGKYIEDADSLDVRQEFCAVAVLTGIFAAAGLYFVMAKINAVDVRTLWVMAAASAVLGLAVFYLLLHPQKSLSWVSRKNLNAIVCLFCALPFVMKHACMTMSEYGEYIQHCRQSMWNNFQPADLQDDSYFRIMSNGGNYPNLGLNMGYSPVLLFNSMVTGAECDFYARTGARRLQSNETSRKDFPLLTFLSVKYDFYTNLPLTGGVTVEPKDVLLGEIYECEGFNDYEVYGDGGLLVFRNDAYIPMGFTYDCYLPLDETESFDIRYIANEKKSRIQQMLLLRAIWLTDEQIERYGGLLTPLPEEAKKDVSLETYYKDCAARAASACDVFRTRSDGFDAEITLERDNLVFFSVPYQEGFTAKVDGQPVQIERVFDGLSAVPVSAGRHQIAFDYRTPGLDAGFLVSLCSAGLLALYGTAAVVSRRKKQRRS